MIYLLIMDYFKKKKKNKALIDNFDNYIIIIVPI